MGGDACVMGAWPSAGAAPPKVKPPANVAPLFRSSRRLRRFEPIGLSFADEPKRNRLPEVESIRPSRTRPPNGSRPRFDAAIAYMRSPAGVRPVGRPGECPAERPSNVMIPEARDHDDTLTFPFRPR